MPAQVSGILLVAVFAVAALVGAVLACRLVALSAPSVRHPPGRKVRREGRVVTEQESGCLVRAAEAA